MGAVAYDRISLGTKMRMINSNIRPIMEYGMEVWGPAPGAAAESLFARPDAVLVRAVCMACGVRAYAADDAAWMRVAEVSSDAMVSAANILPMSAACDLARHRYGELLRVTASAADLVRALTDDSRAVHDGDGDAAAGSTAEDGGNNNDVLAARQHAHESMAGHPLVARLLRFFVLGTYVRKTYAERVMIHGIRRSCAHCRSAAVCSL